MALLASNECVMITARSRDALSYTTQVDRGKKVAATHLALKHFARTSADVNSLKLPSIIKQSTKPEAAKRPASYYTTHSMSLYILPPFVRSTNKATGLGTSLSTSMRHTNIKRM